MGMTTVNITAAHFVREHGHHVLTGLRMFRIRFVSSSRDPYLLGGWFVCLICKHRPGRMPSRVLMCPPIYHLYTALRMALLLEEEDILLMRDRKGILTRKYAAEWRMRCTDRTSSLRVELCA